jgi:hypothetical protein
VNFCAEFRGGNLLLCVVKLPFLIDTDTASDDAVASTGDRGWRRQNFL